MTTARTGRRAGATAAGLVLAMAALLTAAPAAHAATYRYWTYWQGGTGEWAFATAGPASLIPADGAVEGWRFALTTQAGSAADRPGVPPSFADICGSTPAAEGSKRVALVVDPGPPSAAPQGQSPPAAIVTCAEVPADATGYQVLRSVTGVRTDGGLICGIDGYPTGECAPIVDDQPASAAASPAAGPTASDSAMAPSATPAASDSGTPWATLAVMALAAAGVGLLVWRRRRA
jgi:LPXTG-motif cell wall-anchored protein